MNIVHVQLRNEKNFVRFCFGWGKWKAAEFIFIAHMRVEIEEKPKVFNFDN